MHMVDAAGSESTPSDSIPKWTTNGPAKELDDDMRPARRDTARTTEERSTRRIAAARRGATRSDAVPALRWRRRWCTRALGAWRAWAPT